MDAFTSTLEAKGISKQDAVLKRSILTTLQVNLGNICNQNCSHCHVAASPEGAQVMSRPVIGQILNFLRQHPGLVLDITGGAPEMNPDFEFLVEQARPLVKDLIVRSNLTVMQEKDKKHLPAFYKKNNVHLICSLPCYTEENVDRQRGKGVFKKSIRGLHELNKIGYGREKGLGLDLVYNPGGATLPARQERLQQDYAQTLQREFDIVFNRLLTITNVPINRFKSYLDERGEYQAYIELLQDNFNPGTVEQMMCRMFLSVGYDGRVYDCDFNQQLGWELKNERGEPLTIDQVTPAVLHQREIMLGEHCLSCTAGNGSGCQGALNGNAQPDETPCSGTASAETVKEYYGKVLQSKADLKTSCCTSSEAFPEAVRPIVQQIVPEILDKFYGCGSPIPAALAGCTVLDLGCGTGRDVYIVSKLVGESGQVIGVDMTDEQLTVAHRHQKEMARRFGYARSNVSFKKGYIENLALLGIADNSVDVVISNCVLNLSFDKRKVFSEIFRVLKPGGELYFSDVFSGRRLPDHWRNDPLLVGECIGGALYIEDFRRLLCALDCPDYRVVHDRRLQVTDPQVKAKVGLTPLFSRTVRAFKLSGLEDRCEDYGQIATYLGTVDEQPHAFTLDDHHILETGKPLPVCGNTAAMLQHTRFGKHFRISGDRSRHFGPFAAAPSSSIQNDAQGNGAGCC